MASTSESHIYIPTTASGSKVLFFFIPGNPGCVSYYDAFFTHLHDAFSVSSPTPNSSPNVQPALVGTSLGNFSPTPDKEDGSFSLQGQIAFIESQLYEWSEKVRDGNDLKVILAGHSVGAFIGMEVLRRWMESERTEPEEDAKGEGKAEAKESTKKLHPNVTIAGFIGLWPTITYIRRSRNGRRMGGLLGFAPLALLASILVRLLALLLPTALLRLLVRKATGFPDDATETTLSLIQHPFQVRQALHMARDEMKEITADRWRDDVWHAGPKGPKLTFLFGSEDHWIENDAREELFQTRRTTESRKGATMEIDEEGIPHSFCIHHSKAVAERTAGLIRDIIDA